MRTTFRIFVYCFICTSFFSSSLFAQDSESVNVTVTNGELIRCVTENQVQIELKPNPQKTLVRMRLFWNAGEPAVIVNPEDNFTLTNEYNFEEEISKCTYDCDFKNGFCREIRVFADYAEGADAEENNSLLLTFKIPPTADFEFDNSQPCVNTEISFTNNSCPSDGDEITYEWIFPGGATSAEKQPSFTFTNSGSIPVTLNAISESCGTNTRTKNITVIQPAEPNAFPRMSDISSQRLDTFIICGQGLYRVQLIGSQSIGASRYRWTSFPSSGVNFSDDLSRNRDTTNVSFSRPGIYRITLEVDNNCNQPSEQDLIFNVVESQALSLEEQSDACNSLNYTPSPFIEEATYRINGQIVSRFPTLLSASPTPYIVSAELTNACVDGVQMMTDTFAVIDPTPVDILSPSMDTAVCLNADIINLSSSIEGGRWRIDGRNAGAFFDPSDFSVGRYRIEYEVGIPGCEVEDEVQIEILPGPQLDIGQDETLCEDGTPITLQANEAGGMWMGEGITDAQAGTFDPTLVSGNSSRITYTLQDASDGCVASISKDIDIVSLPRLGPLDNIFVCNSPETILLSDIATIPVNPGGGTLTWSGPGITNANTGAFDAVSAGGIGFVSIAINYSIPPGCSSTDTLELEIGPLVQAEATMDTTVCTSQDPIRLSGFPEGGIWLDQNNRTINNPVDPGRLAPNTYRLTYVINRGTSCETSAQTSFTVVAGDGVNAGDDLYICESENELILPNRNGEWSGTALGPNNTLNIDSLGLGTYDFLLTNSNLPPACNTDDLRVFVEPIPDIGFMPDTALCTGDPVDMNNTSNADRFSWDFGDGSRVSNASNPSHPYQRAGTFEIILTIETLNPITNQALCENQLVRSTRIYEPPSFVGFTSDVMEGCAPLSVNLTNESRGERLRFNWDLGDGNTSEEINPQDLVYDALRSDTTYFIRLTVANGCGTDLEATQEIRVLADPFADFATELRTEYCSGEIVSIGHQSFADSLEWDFDNGTTFRGFDPPDQQYFTSLDFDTITLTLIAKNRCGIDTAFQDLQIVPTDARADISVLDNRPCLGDTVFLRSLSRPFGAPVEWTFPDATKASGDETFYVFQSLGQQQITAKVFSCGLDSTDLIFDVNPAPVISLSAPPQTCPDTEFDINIASSEVQNFLYINDSLVSNRQVFQAVLDSIGQFRLRAEALSTDGCVREANRMIEVMEGPEASFVMLDSVCARASFVLQSTSARASSCLWTTSNGITLTECTAAFSFPEQGVQSAKLVVTNNIGCKDSVEQVVFVRPTPTADFDLEVIRDCTPGQILLTNTSVNANGIQWQLPNNQTDIRNTFTAAIVQSGTLPVGLIASNDGICFDTLTQPFRIFQSPILELIKTPNCTVEEGFQLEILAEPISDVEVLGTQYRANGTLHNNLLPDDYFLSATSANGCTTDTITAIPAVNELKANLIEDTIKLRLGESTLLQNLVNQTNVTYEWSSPEFLDLTNPAAPIATPFTTTDFIMTVKDTFNCEKTDTVTVLVEIDREYGVFVPNAFTPDNNGNNDVFRLRSTNPGVEQLQVFRVTDQNGNIMFENKDCDPNDLNCAWDGTFRGKIVRAGVYIYQIVIEYTDGKTVVRQGDVTLIK